MVGAILLLQHVCDDPVHVTTMDVKWLQEVFSSSVKGERFTSEEDSVQKFSNASSSCLPFTEEDNRIAFCEVGYLLAKPVSWFTREAFIRVSNHVWVEDVSEASF